MSAKPIPCFRCGAPVALGVADLVTKLQNGTITATKAYFHHGPATDEGDACGAVLRPGAVKEKSENMPFRNAVKRAVDAAMASEGYVKVMHVPLPVKAGGPEEANARATSRAIQEGMSRKAPMGANLSAECLFVKLPGGEWADRATVSAVETTAPVASAPTPTVAPTVATPPGAFPAPPAPPAPIVAPPPPPPPPVPVATVTGVVTVPMAEARAMLSDGRAYSAFIGGAWVSAIP
jgi:hypothetical protein